MNSDKDFQAMADLLKQAGPRPQPDPEVADAVYQAVADEWERSVAKPRRAWPVWAAAASLAAVAIVVGLMQSVAPASRFDVARLDGTASQWVDDAWLPLATGDKVLEGRRVRIGAASRMALVGPPGVDLRIDENTEFSMDGQILELSVGAVFLDLSPLVRDRFQVNTEIARVSHIGTRFAVRYQDQDLSIMVRDGRVAVESGGERVELNAGQTVQADRDGVGETVEQALDADAWQWVADISPGLKLDGRSVADFLDWVAAESGMRPVYANAATEQAARQTMLAGSVSGMSALDALSPVLQATRFSASIENGVISIVQTL